MTAERTLVFIIFAKTRAHVVFVFSLFFGNKIERKEDRFFIFTEFVEVEQCEIKGEKERKPDPESDLQLEL